MIRGDSEAAAAESASLVSDPRAARFYDAGRLAGRAVAASIGAQNEVARDMYLFYEPPAGWDGAAGPPRPTAWFHQLGGDGREWADPSRFRWSARLVGALEAEVSRRWNAGGGNAHRP